MKDTKKQLFNGLFIILGAICLLYSIAVDDSFVAIQIIGLVCLMYGAYNASRHWAVTKDSYLDEEE